MMQTMAPVQVPRLIKESRSVPAMVSSKTMGRRIGCRGLTFYSERIIQPREHGRTLTAMTDIDIADDVGSRDAAKSHTVHLV